LCADPVATAAPPELAYATIRSVKAKCAAAVPTSFVLGDDRGWFGMFETSPGTTGPDRTWMVGIGTDVVQRVVAPHRRNAAMAIDDEGRRHLVVGRWDAQPTPMHYEIDDDEESAPSEINRDIAALRAGKDGRVAMLLKADSSMVLARRDASTWTLEPTTASLAEFDRDGTLWTGSTSGVGHGDVRFGLRPGEALRAFVPGPDPIAFLWNTNTVRWLASKRETVLPKPPAPTNVPIQPSGNEQAVTRHHSMRDELHWSGSAANEAFFVVLRRHWDGDYAATNGACGAGGGHPVACGPIPITIRDRCEALIYHAVNGTILLVGRVPLGPPNVANPWGQLLVASHGDRLALASISESTGELHVYVLDARKLV